MDTTKMTTEVQGLKNKLRATWMAGDFSEIAKSIETGAEEFDRFDVAVLGGGAPLSKTATDRR